MTKLIAYQIDVGDCGAYFYVGQDDEDGQFCSNCGSALRETEFLPRNIEKRRFRGDWGHTFDGHLLITERAVAFLKRWNIQFELIQTNDRPRLYDVVFTNKFTFDAKATGTRFLDFCDTCQQYESVVGVTPQRFSKNPDLDPMNIYNSDLMFASGREKGPVTVVGVKMKEHLAKEFPEIYFNPVTVQ